MQVQLLQREKEILKSQELVRSAEGSKLDVDKEVSDLKNDISVMRGKLIKMDREKDELLVCF